MEKTNQKVDAASLLTRTLYLKQALTDAQVQALKQLVGVTKVVVDAQKLVLSYDASQLQLDKVLELSGITAQIKASGWQKIRLALYRMVDQNTAESAAHVPHCCNKTPKV